MEKLFSRFTASQQALHKPPVRTLESIFALLDPEDLSSFAKYDLELSCDVEDREAVTRALVAALADKRVVKELIMQLDAGGWDFFRRALDADPLVEEDSANLDFLDPLDAYLLHPFYHEDKMIYIVPDEIREVMKALETEGFFAEKDFAALVSRYAAAAVNLYGCVELADFAELFNAHNKQKIDAEKVQALLGPCQDMHFYIVDDLLVQYDLDLDEDDEMIEMCLKAAERYDRYFPGKKAFLAYASYSYMEQTPQLSALERFLAPLFPEKAELVEMALRLGMHMFSWAHPVADVVEMFGEEGLHFKKDQGQTLHRLLLDASEHARRFDLCGNMLCEMRRPRAPGLPGPVKANAAGRNDPCPCGSGKKYKKCCGQAQ